jgi:hypothetical protein
MTALAAVALCSATSQALAQQDAEEWDPWEKWSVSAGVFVADLSNTARIGSGGTGLEFDLESALGLESSQSVFRIDGAYRFGADNRHRVDFTWFDMSRDATRTLQRDIEIDGTVYPIGTTVNSQYDLAFYNLRYAYSFIKDDRIDFAGSVGLHITEIGLFVNDTDGLIAAGGDSVTAPLPLVGMRLDVALTPKWYVRSSVEALYLSYDKFTGSVVDILLAGEYRGWEHFSLGVGFNAVRLQLENDDSLDLGFNGEVRVDFVGLMLYGKAMF